MTPATILERLYQRAEDTANLDIYPESNDSAAEELNMLQEAMIMLSINCNDWYNGTIKGNGP